MFTTEELTMIQGQLAGLLMLLIQANNLNPSPVTDQQVAEVTITLEAVNRVLREK